MLLFALAACTTDDLSEGWQIDRLRVLAVAADPAEPRPGDTVTFRSLVIAPDVPVAATIWFACLFGDDETGCVVDDSLFSDLDPSTLSADDVEALEEAGFIGAEPYLPPTWHVPADALDALSPEERAEGLTALVNVVAVPEGEDLDEGDLEIAFKRVPVSEATTPNHNPVVTGVTVDSVPVQTGATLTLDAGEPYTLCVTLGEGSVESYAYLTEEGAEETREEEPYFSWYAEQGSFDQTDSLWPFRDTTFYAPNDPTDEPIGIWVVVRDRRGGMDWASLTVRVR